MKHLHSRYVPLIRNLFKALADNVDVANISGVLDC